MRISMLDGVFIGVAGNIRHFPPMNMWPVLGANGVTDGYLRTAPGLTLYATGPGADRGSILWLGAHYRVMGSKLVRIDSGGVVTTLGDVGNDGNPVTFDYGFDRLMIVSAGGLYYWTTASAFIKVTDPNLGTPIDGRWIDGYYMLTDGSYLYVTELNDPTTIWPLKYGSAEADPDPIVAVQRVRDEIYAVGTNSIENFQNVGGTGFPFQRNPGGLVPKGAVGTHAVCYYLDTLAFVGSGRLEEPSVYLAGYGTTDNISTPEIDRLIQATTLTQRAAIEVESVTAYDEQRLFVHLPTTTLVYHRQASLAAQKPVWTQLAGGVNMDQAYPVRHFAYSGFGWLGGSSSGQIGSFDETVQAQFGAATTGEFQTLFLYNEGRGAILKSAELIGAPGLAGAGVTPMAYASWTNDGHTWSTERAIPLGQSGDYRRRMQWRPMTRMWTYMGLKIRLPDPALASFAALEIGAEPLNA